MPGHTPHLSIIGAGTVGSTLGAALSAKGYGVLSVISRTGSDAISLARKVRARRASTDLKDLDPGTDILLVTVPDSALSDVASRTAKASPLRFSKLLALHCSGVHPAGILKPLERKGALVAAAHPVQTFPHHESPARLRSRLRGIFYGMDGSPAALTRAEKLVKDLAGTPVLVPKEMKPLYHTACVFASNYLLMLISAVDELARAAGLKVGWTEVFGPLMTATMEDAVRAVPVDALTGPIVRGDYSTVRLHLGALMAYAPQFLPLYIVAGIEIARAARARGRLRDDQFQELIGLFRASIKSQPSKVKQ
jgi:predicted short-subunit dehydrogenase-like oxidoreductase (DUF2520 family)